MLDQAFEALKTYDWGADRAVLNPIDEAVISSRGDAAARGELEKKLTAVLTSEVSRDAKDYVCRVLMQIGTAASVPTLAGMLSNPDLAHMARYALERMPAPEAAQALRDAAGKLSGKLQIGAISSLGARGDANSIGTLSDLANHADPAIGKAAAYALGAIRTPAAAEALGKLKPSAATQMAVTDARLACAEGLLANGNAAAALAIYKAYVGEGQPQHVRVGATRGMLACAGKKN